MTLNSIYYWAPFERSNGIHIACCCCLSCQHRTHLSALRIKFVRKLLTIITFSINFPYMYDMRSISLVFLYHRSQSFFSDRTYLAIASDKIILSTPNKNYCKTLCELLAKRIVNMFFYGSFSLWKMFGYRKV